MNRDINKNRRASIAVQYYHRFSPETQKKLMEQYGSPNALESRRFQFLNPSAVNVTNIDDEDDEEEYEKLPVEVDEDSIDTTKRIGFRLKTFRHVIKRLAHAMIFLQEVPNSIKKDEHKIKITSNFILAMQDIVQHYLVNLFQDANALRSYCKRKTLQHIDILMIRKLRFHSARRNVDLNVFQENSTLVPHLSTKNLVNWKAKRLIPIK